MFVIPFFTARLVSYQSISQQHILFQLYRFYIHLIFGSVLLIIRFMLAICRYITNNVNAPTTIISPISPKKMETINEITPVIMEESDTYLDIFNDSKNVTTITTNKIGLTPRIIPPEVATALPPLKRANIG